MSSKPIQFNCIYIHIISTISSSAFSKTLVSGGPMPRLICCGFAHLCPGSRTLQSSPPPAWIRISSFSHHRPHLLLLPLLLQRVCGLVTAPERRVWPFRSRIGRLGLRDSKLCSAVTHKNMVEMKPPGGPIFRIPVMRRRIVVRIETSSLNRTHKREVEQNNTLARMMSRSSDPSLESSWLVFGKQEKLKLINPITKRVFSPEKTKNFSAKEKKGKHTACAISGVGCGRCWRGQGDEAWGKRRRRNPSSWSSPHRPRTYCSAPWHNPSSSSTNQRSGQRHLIHTDQTRGVSDPIKPTHKQTHEIKESRERSDLSWACGGGSRSSKQRMEQPERATEERMDKEDKELSLLNIHRQRN